LSSGLSTGTKIKVGVFVILGLAWIFTGLYVLNFLINPPLLSFRLDLWTAGATIVFILGGVIYIFSAIQDIRKGRESHSSNQKLN